MERCFVLPRGSAIGVLRNGSETRCMCAVAVEILNLYLCMLVYIYLPSSSQVRNVGNVWCDTGNTNYVIMKWPL